ncbi:Zinc finger protein NUTCRACKER [Striga hermonthica]|uniref:Zinc finger protein NUTCRACKER n=1 Tax=Striga hermonthica TaxID=68872 RepID=A0A9N7MP42_STRHE|nr:Zinc finger protein NUTCRACKER [Striga hermonthica]
MISIGGSSHLNPGCFNIESDPPPVKKKRNLPGTPDPEAEVIALSPKTLMATNRFLCEICGKGFQRDQNLQLHRRGHNLPWKLKQRTGKEVRKRVYVCPEKTCVHHHASRALGDLTGIKKHYCRKHGEKKWKCEKCSKRYAVPSDWKAHSKTCGTREYRCDCGTIFSRRDSFITHRAFCDALAEETARFTAASHMNNTHYNHPPILSHQFLAGPSLDVQHVNGPNFPPNIDPIIPTGGRSLPLWLAQEPMSKNVQDINPMGLIIPINTTPLNNFATTNNNSTNPVNNSIINWDQFGNNSINCPLDIPLITNEKELSVPSLYSTDQNQLLHQKPMASLSATALLQKAAQLGEISSSDGNKFCGIYSSNSGTSGLASDVEGSVNDSLGRMAKRRRLGNNDHEMLTRGETRDFLGVGMCHPSSINGWM